MSLIIKDKLMGNLTAVDDVWQIQLIRLKMCLINLLLSYFIQIDPCWCVKFVERIQATKYLTPSKMAVGEITWMNSQYSAHISSWSLLNISSMTCSYSIIFPLNSGLFQTHTSIFIHTSICFWYCHVFFSKTRFLLQFLNKNKTNN